MTTYAELKAEIESKLELAAMSEEKLVAEFKPGYFAYVSGDSREGFSITYHHGEMPAYQTESFDTAAEAAAEMMKVGMAWDFAEVEE